MQAHGSKPRKQLESTAGQLEIDFSQRGWQRRALRECRLPKGLKCNSGRPVSRQTAMLVLCKLDAHIGPAGCFPSLEILAAECQGLNEKTVRRAVQALQDVNLLAVKRAKLDTDDSRSGNYYAIIWSEIAKLCPGRENWRSNPASTNRTFSGDQSDILGPSNGHLVSREVYKSFKSNGASYKTRPEQPAIARPGVEEITAPFAADDLAIIGERGEIDRLRPRFWSRLESLTTAEALILIPGEPAMAARPKLFAIAYMKAMEAIDGTSQ